MVDSDWQQVKEIFYAALTQPVAERGGFLNRACGKDESLRSEIEVLLESYESGFLEKPIVAELIPKRHQLPPHFAEGDEFSHYRIVRLLGRGGMGEVYLATDTALDRPAAIKMIHSESGFGDQAAIRLLREARAAAKLDHPNICSVYEVGETEGLPFIAMQFVEGETLDDLLRADAITFADAVHYSRQIASALARAHSAGIVHGDIKPSNLIIGTDGNLRVLDFGLAKEVTTVSTTDGAATSVPVAGTIAYMSPEHLRGQEIDPRSDLWSLGVVFYQMITGRQPFRGTTRSDLIAGILEADLDPPMGVPRRHSAIVDNIFSRALAKDRSKRYASAAELDADLINLEAVLRERRSALKRPTIGIALSLVAVVISVVAWQVYQSPPGTEMLHGSAAAMRIENLFDIKRRAGGAITDLSFSPDGKTLAFTLSDEGPGAIFTLPTSGGKAVRLTDRNDTESSPIWSPGGDRIAFLSRQEDRSTIVTVPSSGGEAVPLVRLGRIPNSATLKRWSNDGNRIFFDDGDGAKAVELESGEIIPIDLAGIDGKVGGYSLSGDETQILAVSSVNGLEQLWLKDLRRGSAQLISESSPRNGVPSWFPANAGFAYSADDSGSFHIYTRPLDGSPPRQITFGNFTASQPVVAPDGQHLAYVSNLDEANIFHVDVATGQQSEVTRNVNLQLFPALSPDGRRIAYQTSNETSKITAGMLKIDPVPSASAETPLSLPEPGCCLKWSPDGRQVAYIRRTGSNFEIYRSEIMEPREIPVTSGGILMNGFALSPFEFTFVPFDWRPDGAAIVFTSNRSGKHNLWQVLSDGSAEMLTDFDGTSRPIAPTYSPDGRRIAYIDAVGSERAATAKEDRIVVLDGAKSVTFGSLRPGIALLGWNPSGDGVFVATTDGYIRLLSGMRSPAGIAQLADVRRRSIRLSPDRQWAAYTVTRQGVNNVCISALRPSAEKCLTTNSDPSVFYSGIVWSPDSKGVYYSKQTGGMQISLISLQEKEQKGI